MIGPIAANGPRQFNSVIPADAQAREMLLPVVDGRAAEVGRPILRVAFRQKMGIAEEDAVAAERHGDKLRVRPVKSAPRRIRVRLRAAAPVGVAMVDHLLAGLREEFADE